MISLTILTLSGLENATNVSFSVVYLECMSSGKRNLEMLRCSALIFFYGVQLFFADRDCQKSRKMESRNFGS